MNKLTHIDICTPSNSVELREVAFQTFEEAYKDINDPVNYELYIKKSFTLAAIQAELAEPKSVFFFLREDNTNDIIGYLKLRSDRSEEFFPSEPALELQRIYIKKALWRHGYGKTLLAYAENYARENAFKWLWLVVYNKNDSAIRFYTREGYEIFANKAFSFGDEIHDDFAMRKMIL